MKYIPEHPRKVIGEPVHETAEVKKEQWHQSMEEKKMEERKKLGLDRPEVEAKYLIPKIKNWVETEQVKEIKERIKMWIKLGYPVHIIGPTGCGKTTMAMQVAKELGRPTVWINGDESVTTTDLIGGYSQVEQETLRDKYIHNVFKDKDILKADWIDNPLTLACKYGYTLVYNEFSRTKPAANNVILSVLEEGILELPTMFGDERYVKVNSKFNSIFTSNSVEYAGVHRAQDALLDRMIGIYMDYYDLDTEVRIVMTHNGTSIENAKKVVSVIRKLREKLPGVEKPGTRACIMLAEGLEAIGSFKPKDIEKMTCDIITSKTKGPVDLVEKQKLIKKVVCEIYGEN